MCYLGIGYLGDAFVDIVQILSPVCSVNSWSTRFIERPHRQSRVYPLRAGSLIWTTWLRQGNDNRAKTTSQPGAEQRRLHA